jgi:hypothetical protein
LKIVTFSGAGIPRINLTGKLRREESLQQILLPPASCLHAHSNMEDDRAQVDLGIAADIEERQEAAVQRQPKKRFVGRRQAAEAASRNGANTSVEDNGAIQSIYPEGNLLS